MINSTVSISNTTFTNNKANCAGGIYLYSFEEGCLNIMNSSFIKNGMDECGNGGALYAQSKGNVSINQSIFSFNIAENGSGIHYVNDNFGTLTVSNSRFDHNGVEGSDIEIGALIIESNGNSVIDNCNFTNNSARTGSALYIFKSQGLINNSVFNENKVNYGTVYLEYTNLTITFTDFIGNTIYDSEDDGCGVAISTYNVNLSLNHTKFIKNNFGDNIYGENDGGAIYNDNGNLSIDNSQFIENYAAEEGGAISSSNDNNVIIINNSLFRKNNVIGPYGYGGAISNTGGNLYVDKSQFIENSVESEGGAIYNYDYGKKYEMIITNSSFEKNKVINEGFGGAISSYQNKAVIDNCTFISNFAHYNENTYGAAIYAPDYNYYPYGYFNVTNSVFVTNDPDTFEINNGRIELTHDDNYVPNYANVTIFVNEENEGTETKLLVDNQNISYMENYPIDPSNYAYKLIVTHNENADLYEINTFKNNVYFIRLNHNYTLSLYANNVSINSNSTISGKLYYNYEGTDIALKNKEIELYINNVYINSTNTSENGEYTFNYTANETGVQNVKVIFNGDNYLSEISNNTTIHVEKRNTTIIITATNTTIYNTSNINIELKDYENKPVPNANITYYINEVKYTNTTDSNGKIQLKYNTIHANDNHIFVVYEGNYTYNSCHNMTTFRTNKLNTIITIHSENATLGETITITGKLTDINNKEINNAKIILFIDENEIILITNATGEFERNYTTIHTKENYIEVFYEGNDTYNDSITYTQFYVYKINTTTTATINSNMVGNLSLQVNITGNDNKKISNGTILVYDEKDEIIAAQNIKNTTIISITNITGGTYTFNVMYEGNDTYNPSNKTIKVTIKKEASINIEELNTTEGNITLELTLTDETGTGIPDTIIQLKLLNGTTTNMTTDKDGKINIIDTTTSIGEKTITATVPTTEDIIGTTETKTINITPDYQKIIDEMNKTIQEQQETIYDLNDTIQEQQNIIDNQNKTIKKQEETINELENIIDTLNKTSVITAIPENGTVENNNVIVTLDNKLGIPITDAPITVKNSKGETIGTSKTDSNGIAVIPVNTKAGTESVTVSYPGNDKYTPANTTISVTTRKNNVLVTVDPIEGIIGENITLTAHVTDMDGNLVSGGNIVFKLNGKTLRVDGRFDSKADPWKFKLNNGKVTVTIKADLYLRNTKNITASYSGTYKYKETKSSPVTAQIKKRNAIIKVTATPKTQKQYNTITFKATLTDTTPNTKNTTAISTDTKVIFKINGKTIKDKDGNNLLVKVVNQTATYKYTVPQGMGGITKTGETRNYTVEAVMVSDTYYPDTRNTTTFNVQRSPTTINIDQITLNNKNQLSVKATIKDYKNKNVIGNNTVAIKINGKTYVNPTTNKTSIFTVENGKINLRNIALSSDITIKKVTIVTGDRQAYLGQRIESSNIVKL